MCDTKVKFKLPHTSKYFAKGKFFEFGTMNMEMQTVPHETDCIH